MNQVQEFIQAGVQRELSQYYMPAQEKNTSPNLTPALTQELQSANQLTDVDIARLAQALAPTLPPKPPPHTHIPKTYTGIAHGVDAKGHLITYCSSHSWTRNLDRNSKNCTRKKEGHKVEATLDNKMGGVEG